MFININAISLYNQIITLFNTIYASNSTVEPNSLPTGSFNYNSIYLIT